MWCELTLCNSIFMIDCSLWSQSSTRKKRISLSLSLYVDEKDMRKRKVTWASNNIASSLVVIEAIDLQRQHGEAQSSNNLYCVSLANEWMNERLVWISEDKRMSRSTHCHLFSFESDGNRFRRRRRRRIALFTPTLTHSSTSMLNRY